jgi:hypothetical protein
MSDELPQGWALPQPDRAKESSPPIHRWVWVREGNESRQGRKKSRALFRGFFRPSGAWRIWRPVNPAINRWAIFGRPCGTKVNGGVEQ